jgi:hypothetical protein
MGGRAGGGAGPGGRAGRRGAACAARRNSGSGACGRGARRGGAAGPCAPPPARWRRRGSSLEARSAGSLAGQRRRQLRWRRTGGAPWPHPCRPAPDATPGALLPLPPPPSPQVDRSKDQLFFASESSLTYLDGTLPGDFGFDPLGLLDPVNSGGFITPEWLQYSEVIHGRCVGRGGGG